MTSIPAWKYLKALPAKITNKYVIAIVAFVVWMTFFDKNNFLAQRDYTRSIKELQLVMTDYESEMALLEQQYQHMLKYPERYARERHLMHKQKERLFIMRDKPEDIVLE